MNAVEKMLVFDRRVTTYLAENMLFILFTCSYWGVIFIGLITYWQSLSFIAHSPLFAGCFEGLFLVLVMARKKATSHAGYVSKFWQDCGVVLWLTSAVCIDASYRMSIKESELFDHVSPELNAYVAASAIAVMMLACTFFVYQGRTVVGKMYVPEFMTVPIAYLIHIKEKAEQGEREREHLQGRHDELLKQITTIQLIHNPEEDIAPYIQRGICVICKKDKITRKTHSLCHTCHKRFEVVMQRVNTQRHRASSRGLPATLTVYEWLTKLEHFNGMCAYCQMRPATVIEHYVPISLGGGTTGENCVPACPQCNGKKHAKKPE